jgi:hypothetical protein
MRARLHRLLRATPFGAWLASARSPHGPRVTLRARRRTLGGGHRDPAVAHVGRPRRARGVPGLAPGLLASPALRPRLHLIPAPNSAAGVLGDRRGEVLLLGDLVSALLGHAEELSDLDERSVFAVTVAARVAASGSLREAPRANLQVDRWGGQDLNLRPTDYESATPRRRSPAETIRKGRLPAGMTHRRNASVDVISRPLVDSWRTGRPTVGRD